MCCLVDMIAFFILSKMEISQLINRGMEWRFNFKFNLLLYQFSTGHNFFIHFLSQKAAREFFHAYNPFPQGLHIIKVYSLVIESFFFFCCFFFPYIYKIKLKDNYVVAFDLKRLCCGIFFSFF